MNLFELFVKIGVDDQASGKLSNLSSKLGNGLKTAAKIGTAAVATAAAGITALTTAAVNNYAEYEQLVGGIDTLFKNSSKKVQKYAADAYKTAGLSANKYMETVTSFSASLLQSLENDTEAATDYADKAITDMSDNANKMGTSMEMIQNAYQGFAKQNYTMLDNLKLGYGGTKTEMERLIADAAKLSDTVDAQSMSFDNIVEAIHVVQTEMGITGTTALEAGRTISGSIASMKSAWTNLITGLADGNADIGQLVDNLVTTIVGDGTESNLGVLGNIMPAIKTALNGASKLVSELLPEIVAEIPTIISENLPVLASAAVSVIQSLADGISENSDLLVGAFFDAFESVISQFPELIKSFTELIPDLLDSILKELPGAIETIVSALTDGGVVERLTEAIIEIVESIADNLPAIIQAIVDAIPKITESVNNAIRENFPTFLQAVVDLIVSIVQELPSIITTLTDQIGPIIATIVSVIIENLPLIIEAIVTIVFEIIKALPEILLSIWNALVGWISDMAEEIGNQWPVIKENFQEAFSHAIDGIKEAWNGLMQGISELWNKLKNWFASLWESVKKIGSDIVDGIWEGLKGSWHKVVNWFNKAWNNLVKGVKDFLGIRSPSRVFAGVGKNMALGVSEGWQNSFSKIKDDINKSMIFDDASIAINSSSIGHGSVGGVSVVQNIYSEAKTAADLMQEAIYQQERAVLLGV